jgi:hypothetical protein
MSSKVHVALSDIIFYDENRRGNMGQIIVVKSMIPNYCRTWAIC